MSPLKQIFQLVNVRAAFPILLHKEALALTCFKELLGFEVNLCSNLTFHYHFYNLKETLLALEETSSIAVPSISAPLGWVQSHRKT